jgi:hypothetical protein
VCFACFAGRKFFLGEDLWSSGRLANGREVFKLSAMAAINTKAKPTVRKARAGRELGGRQLARILQKIDSAKSPAEKKRWRREFMRGFYGDSSTQAVWVGRGPAVSAERA